MADNDQKTEIDLQEKFIDSEVDETSNENVEETSFKDKQQAETVVIKKGGFISFLSLLLSVSALAASAYLYLESQKPKQQPINVDSDQWKLALADLDSKLSKNIKQIKTQTDQAKQLNQDLSSQVSELQTKLNQTANLNLTHETTKALYDDDTFSKKVEQLESQILQNKQRYESVNSALTKANETQKQELTKLQNIFANQQAKQTKPKAIITNPNEFKFELAKNLLQAATIQLDIHQNLDRASQLLKQASSQVKQIPGQTYANFAFEIEQTVQSLNNIESLDTEATTQKINRLKSQVSKLDFQSAKVETKQDGSWFDKLVVIRKIEDNDVQILTAAEQMVVMNQLNNSFDILSFALLSQNQKKWKAAISQIDQALKKHFASNSIEIQTQLQKLAEIKLTTEYPSISSLLKTFEQYRNSNKPFSKE